MKLPFSVQIKFLFFWCPYSDAFRQGPPSSSDMNHLLNSRSAGCTGQPARSFPCSTNLVNSGCTSMSPSLPSQGSASCKANRQSKPSVLSNDYQVLSDGNNHFYHALLSQIPGWHYCQPGKVLQL